MRRLLTILVCFILVITNIEFKPVNAATVTGYNYLNNGYIQFTDNLGSDWLNLPNNLIGNAVNDYGNLNNPYYFNGSVWRPLTLSRKMEYAVSEGGTLVSESDPYNVTGAGAIVYPATSSLALTNFTVDGSGIIMKEQATTAGSVTYTGTLISKGTLNINGKNLEFTNSYTLLEGKSFVRVKTTVKNISEVSASNVRYWVGTGDDWISTEDRNYKYRGNIIDGAFVTSTDTSTQSRAIRVDTNSHSDSILFYSTHPNANTSVSGCCSFENAVNVNPINSVVSTFNDGSYAMFVNLGTIDPGSSKDFDWYYAAGSAATILDTINDVALDSSGASNVTVDSATIAYTSETTTTGYYMVVQRGSTVPTPAQIIGDEEYTSSTVYKRSSSFMEAGVETTFEITDLTPGTDYDVYFVTRNSENVVSSISLTQFSTAPLSIISLRSITTVDVPKNHRVPDVEAIETDEYTATVSWSPSDEYFENGVVYTATITVTPKFGYTLSGVPANAFTVTGASATNAINEGIISAVYPAVPLDRVYFNSNGGSTISSVEYDYDALISEPLDVSRQGYEFAGWYEDDETFLNPWDFSTEKMPSSDLNLYAKWSALDQTLTFKANGGVGSDVTQVAKTDSTTVLTSNTFTRAGYSFIGWASNSSANTPDYSNIQSITWFNTNTTLYAIWSANNQTITFSANGGVGSNTTQIAKTDSSTALNLNTFTKQGYSFSGWSQNASASTPDYTNGQTITWFSNNAYFYAVWSADDQTITFKANGGVGDDTTQVAKSDSSTELELNTFTKQGYSFAGWARSSSASTPDYTNGQSITWVNTNTSLYAVWTADDQTLTFKANGGVGDDVTQVAKTDSTTILTSNTFTRTGYSFVGWSTKSSENIADYSDEESITWFNTDTTFYAIWTADDQTLTFKANGGVGDDTTQVAKSDSSTELELNVFTKLGYTFAGWATSSSAITPDYTNGQTITWFNANTTLYAVWTAADQTLTFKANGGVGEDTTQVAKSDSSTMLDVNPFMKPGHTFVGWSLNPDATDETYLNQEEITWFKEDTTLYAIWSINYYTINFIENGGSTVTNQNIMYNTPVTFPSNPSKYGYTFLGWMKNDETSYYDFSELVVEDFNLSAKWRTNVYSITYDFAVGLGDFPSSYTVSDSITLGVPVRLGYRFNGWLLNGNPVNGISSGSTGELNFVATWVFVPKDPELSSVTISDISVDSALISARVVDFGNPRAVNFGFELTNLDTNTIVDFPTDSKLSLSLSNLDSYTNYSVRAYVNVGTRVIYTESVEFKTQLVDTDEDGIPDTRDDDPEDTNKTTSFDNVSYTNPSALTLTGVLDSTKNTYSVKINIKDLIDLDGDDTITVMMGSIEYTIPVALVDDLFSSNDDSYLELVVNSDVSSSKDFSILDSVDMDLVNAYDYSLFLVKADGTSTQIHSFSGRIKVSINLEDGQDPTNLEVYYFDEESNSLESMDAEFDDSSNSLVFYTDHFSYYVLGVKKADSVSPLWFGLGFIVVLGFGLLLFKRKKSNQV